MATATRFDHQGRNVEAVRKAFAAQHAAHVRGTEYAAQAFAAIVAECPLADWTVFEGVRVLRCGSASLVAVPCSKRAANFDVIDLEGERSFVTKLKASEVYQWLWAASRTRLGV